VLILTNIKRFLTILILKQIKELFVVDLQEGTVDSVVVGASLLVSSFQSPEVLLFELDEDLFDGSRNNPELGFILQEAVNVAIELQSTKGVLPRIGIIVPMLTKHGVGLSRSSLSVGKNGRIESSNHIKHAVYLQNKRLANKFKTSSVGTYLQRTDRSQSSECAGCILYRICFQLNADHLQL